MHEVDPNSSTRSATPPTPGASSKSSITTSRSSSSKTQSQNNKSLNELPTYVKSQHYHWEVGSSVAFRTNFDLYRSCGATCSIPCRCGWGPIRLRWIGSRMHPGES
ncbi:hypothetical protein AAC387_Pa09g0539 [Persea americana]